MIEETQIAKLVAYRVSEDDFLNNLGSSPTESIDLNRRLANYLLTLKEGDRLLSSRDIADLFGASLGSVSSAFNSLEEIGAVTINRRGRLGSYLEKKSLGILWRVIENGPMVIALTLPSFPKSEGLATAIYSLLDHAGIETYLVFIRGSYNRIKALRNNRCHATVMSALAADNLCEANEEIILTLPPQSFVMDHQVVFRRTGDTGPRPLRVGIDVDSFDIKYLTKLEFADSDVEYCPVTFMEIDLHLDQSSLDAAISNLDYLDQRVGKEIYSRPLSPRVQELIGNRDTSAAVIVRAGAVSTKTILKEILDPEAVMEIQQRVVAGQMVPRY
jgi:hypothetical protein